MKYILRQNHLALIVLLILINSCRHIVIVDSRAEIVSRSIDTALNDSALIYGTVFFGEDEKVPMQNANIWIGGSNNELPRRKRTEYQPQKAKTKYAASGRGINPKEIKTTSDNLGIFRIKILPGIYTVKCLGEKYEEKFTVILNNLSISPDEKVEIKFFHGYIVE